ncbi:dual specificity protein phosphatase family protein [Candidatus Woesearchaeota archaeon]|nr:dual specificity protein phosphatase family protein [Candidatus Woesearchaeota archaeon]
MKHLTAEGLEYSQINSFIFIGTNMCCQFHFDKSLLKKGIRADISMEEKKIDTPFGVYYYLWLPVNNHKAPTQKQLNLGVNVLDFFVKNKIKCYVHCKNGHGRAPTLVSAYLIATGKNVKEAVEFIKKKRNSIHLDRVQINSLKKFEENQKVNDMN